MPFTIDWNDRRLMDALAEPFHQANEVLGREFQAEITARKWPWISSPTPRDIVDTGELRRSYAGERDGKFVHSHAWNIEYAMAVHEGAKFKSGKVYPARPWTRDPLEGGTLEQAFARLARRALGGVR